MRYGTKVGFFELNPFPGCNQIVVSNHSFIRKNLRGNGLGSTEHGNRLSLIKELGYNYSLCTVKDCNVPQIKILEKFGWKLLDTFFNEETESKIRIYGKNIQ